jgi:hypothetical protein
MADPALLESNPETKEISMAHQAVEAPVRVFRRSLFHSFTPYESNCAEAMFLPILYLTCLALESIVEVRMATLDERPCAGDEVGGKKNGSPQLVLMHVRTLMHACLFQGPCVPADHDMAQRDCLGAARQGREPTKRAVKLRTMRFDDSVLDRSVSTPEQCESQHEPENGRGTGP